MNEMTSPGSG